MDRLLPYTHFGNAQQSQRIDDGRSDNESIVDSNPAAEQKLNVRGDTQSMGLQMPNNPHNIFSGNGQTAGTVYDETFMQARGAAALAEMESKIAAQSFTSGMLIPPQVDNSFGHHSMEQVANNSNTAFQAEMAALCQQQMLHAQMLQQTCFTPVTGIQHYNNSAASTTSNTISNNLQSSSSMAHFQQNLNNSSPFGLHNYYSPHQQQQSLLASNTSPTANSFLLPNVSNIVEANSSNISLNRNTQKQQQNQQRFNSGTAISTLYGATANLNANNNIAEIDTDPLELQHFAEHFKQRRIKLGVTQADVGKALAYLKMAGVGSLSQSTICRFESLTLSHNNMVALKPILQSWLERAEEATKQQAVASAAVEAGGVGGAGGDALTLQCIAAATAASAGILPCSEKKRKRTSIAAPEKTELEEQFKLQSRPTGDRIAAIAEKLDLKKNVVRVWFCNQRQKHKRNQFRTNRVISGLSQMASSSDLDQHQKSPISHHQIQHSQYQNTLDNKLVSSCNSTTTAAAASLAAAVQAAAAASMHHQLREQQRHFCQKREEDSEGSAIFENQQRKSSPDSTDNSNCKIENEKIRKTKKYF
uniref:POU domain protein n=1 Tax=Meloidogyne enterolobii TaxID=390850 RepID=A0A6V7VD37_MELEN|nr:unnamed protein product [Meloidogyne enterolobii]